MVRVRTRVVDGSGRTAATLPDRRVTIAAGASAIASQMSAPIARPRLWSPETPTLYHAETTLRVKGRARERFETAFGFRHWVSCATNPPAGIIAMRNRVLPRTLVASRA